MINGKLEPLRREALEFSTLVTDMMNKCSQGLMKRNRSLLEQVIGDCEEQANRREMELEEHCTAMIAQYQPMAKDLRTILMIFKMANDLERIGDHAVNMAQSACFLIERPLVKPLIDIPAMTDAAASMLSDGMRSFLEENVDLAQSVCERDETVGNYRDQIYRELITYMSADPSTVERALHLMRYSRNLERIADLATNLAEDTVFMVRGDVIKHHQGESS